MTGKKHSSRQQDLSPSSQPDEDCAVCAICGSTDQLHADNMLEDVYYCHRCWKRSQQQQRAIDEGYAQEPEVEM